MGLYLLGEKPVTPSVQKITADYILKIKLKKSKPESSSFLLVGQNISTSQHSHNQKDTQLFHLKLHNVTTLKTTGHVKHYQGWKRQRTSATEIHQVSL